ncbi:MAG: response regulator [Rhodospirillales bacterium]
MNRARLLLADDHALVVAGLRKLLEPEFDVVGTAADGHSVILAAERLKPDVILLDISLPLLNGIDAARAIKKSFPEVKIVLVTMHSDPNYVKEAFRAGGSGYVLKRSAASELGTAIREVLAGRTYLTPLASARPTPGKHTVELTPRQREVLQLVAEGRSTKEIAGILKISVKTVEFHKSGIMQKLAMHSTAELTRYAIDHGIIGG